MPVKLDQEKWTFLGTGLFADRTPFLSASQRRYGIEGLQLADEIGVPMSVLIEKAGPHRTPAGYYIFQAPLIPPLNQELTRNANPPTLFSSKRISKAPFIATQLNSTQLNSTSSWVELCRYKQGLKRFSWRQHSASHTKGCSSRTYVKAQFTPTPCTRIGNLANSRVEK